MIVVSAKSYPLLDAAATLLGYRRAEALSPVASTLVGETLARDEMEHLVRMLRRGLVRRLMTGGGWRRQGMPGDPAPRFLWERHDASAFELRLSANSFRVIRWLATARREAPDLDAATLTCGDEWVLALACDVLRARDEPLPSASRLAGACLPLLLHAGRMGAVSIDPTRWVSGPAAVVFEALQGHLSAAWERTFRQVSRAGDEAAVGAIIAAADAVLPPLFEALEGAQRPDLATFLLQAWTTVLEPSTPPQWWIRGLHPHLPLSARQRAATRAAGILRHVEALGAVHRRLAVVRYFDDDYDAAQHVLSLWKPHADRFEQATEHRRGLEGWAAITPEAT